MALNGFLEGFLAGMPAGQQLGDKFARSRSARRMQAVQDAYDAGKYDAKAFGGDAAAGQAQLMTDLRDAQAPLSSRGLDDTYGEGQYDRLLQLSKLRAAQQAGSSVSPGAGGVGPDYSGALSSNATALRGLGDLSGAMQSDQMAGQITAGRNAVNQTGQMTAAGTLPGEVDQRQLAAGVSANNAAMGDASGAAAWGGQQKAQGDVQVQSMLGRAWTIMNNPALGGVQGAAPFVDSAARMMGYGQVQYSPSKDSLSVIGRDGQVVATLDKDSLGAFMQSIGNQPENILSAVRAQQVAAADDARKRATDDRSKFRDAAIDAAGKSGDSLLGQASRTALGVSTLADGHGWKVLSTSDVMKDQVPTGEKRILVQPAPNVPPMLITIKNQATPGDPAFTITDSDGNRLDPQLQQQYGGMAAQWVSDAQQAAVREQLKLDQARFHQTLSNLRDVGSAFGGGGAMGGSVPSSASLGDTQRQVESNNDQSAVSPKGAFGVSQLMPRTAAELEQAMGMPSGSTRTSAAANAAAGDKYRSDLIQQYTQQSGDPLTGVIYGLAAYNYGPGNVGKWIADGADPAKLPKETRDYVVKILSAHGIKAPWAALRQRRTAAALPKVSLDREGRSRVLADNVSPRALPNGPAENFFP